MTYIICKFSLLSLDKNKHVQVIVYLSTKYSSHDCRSSQNTVPIHHKLLLFLKHNTFLNLFTDCIPIILIICSTKTCIKINTFLFLVDQNWIVSKWFLTFILVQNIIFLNTLFYLLQVLIYIIELIKRSMKRIEHLTC